MATVPQLVYSYAQEEHSNRNIIGEISHNLAAMRNCHITKQQKPTIKLHIQMSHFHAFTYRIIIFHGSRCTRDHVFTSIFSVFHVSRFRKKAIHVSRSDPFQTHYCLVLALKEEMFQR
jgi:hypothetical protein